MSDQEDLTDQSASGAEGADQQPPTTPEEQRPPAETGGDKPDAVLDDAPDADPPPELPMVDGRPVEVAGEIRSVTELLAALRGTFGPDEVVWFRGHEDARWQLLPSLARPPRTVDAELMVLKRFKQNAFMFLQRPPAQEWEWLFLMQHYRAPTRLLDWTESPLTGLYFATDTDDSLDGCVWALLPMKLNAIARIEPGFPQDIPCFGEDEELEVYMPSRIHKRRSVQTNTPVAAIAPRQFDRIYAQLGVFTITQKEQIALEGLDDGSHLRLFVVPKGAKAAIREELAYLKIGKLTVFPELENVALASTEGLW